MTIKAFNAGSLALSEVQAEFGGPTTGISMFAYRMGGFIVPVGTVGFPPPNGTPTVISTFPTSGGGAGWNFSLAGFYGASAVVTPTYAISPSTTSANEGTSITFTVTTTNVPNNTTLSWEMTSITGTIQPYDFVPPNTVGPFIPNAFQSGSVLINGGTGSFAVTFVNDLNTDGIDTFQMRVGASGFAGPWYLPLSAVITVNDTSLSPASFTFTETVSSNITSGYDLRARAMTPFVGSNGATAWNGTSVLNASVTVNSGIYIANNQANRGIVGFTTGSTAYASGSILTLTNNGTIAGSGGNGGTGGSSNGLDLTTNPPQPGFAGMPGLVVNLPTNVYNNGTIGGGGGGGGGGGAAYLYSAPYTLESGELSQEYSINTSGGGGGGAAGFGYSGANGAASALGVGAGGDAYGPDSPPANGSLTTAGSGSSSSNVGPFGPDSGPGGRGGVLGQAGFPGSPSGGEQNGSSSPGAGGAAGPGIVGGANITWYTHNTRLGTFDNAGTNVATDGTAGNLTPVDTGGGGGGSGSVSIYAFMPFLSKLAGEFVPGDQLALLDETREGYKDGVVVSNRTSLQKLLRLTSSSGITLTCSDNTPLTLRDGTCINSTEALGVQLPVLDAAGFRWEEIVSVEEVGTGYVATIYCLDQCYAAGDQADRFIFTHNLEPTNNKL